MQLEPRTCWSVQVIWDLQRQGEREREREWVCMPRRYQMDGIAALHSYYHLTVSLPVDQLVAAGPVLLIPSQTHGSSI